MLISFVLALMAGGGVFMLAWGIKATIEGQETFEERFDPLTGRRSSPDAELSSGGEGGPSAGKMLAGAVEKAFVRKGYGDKVRESLSRADLKFTVGEFMIVRMGTTFLGIGVGYLAGITNTLITGFPLPFAIVGAFLGYLAPRIWVSRRASGRLAAFNSQLPDTVALLANGLRSGNSVAQAMSLAAREAPAPTSIEFGRVVVEMSLGINPEDALASLTRRVPSEDLDMMVTAMNVSAQVGGNLAEVLDKIGETIRQRVRLKGDVETLTAQQQGAGQLVSMLPVIIGGVMFLLNGAYMRPMFSGFPYLCMPICAGLLIFIGFMIMQKITDIKV